MRRYGDDLSTETHGAPVINWTSPEDLAKLTMDDHGFVPPVVQRVTYVPPPQQGFPILGYVAIGVGAVGLYFLLRR